MKKALLLAVLSITIAAPALAAPRACLLNDITPTAVACTGFYAGNLLSGSPADKTAQTSALALIGLNWNGNFSQVTKINSLGGNTTVDFSTANQNPLTRMYGDTWVGVHFGRGAGLGGEATGFWKLDTGIAGLQSFLLNISQGSSGAVLYRTGSAPPPPPPFGVVPEPANWVMLIAGFGLVGAVKRRRRLTVVAA